MLNTVETKPSILRVLVLLLISLVLAVIAYKLWDSDYSYAYRKYFFESKDIINLDFRELTPITEAEAKLKYPIGWYCRNEDNQFGDRFCADHIKQWNGIPAMYVVFWYKNGKLSNAKIDVPPWHHEKLAQYFAHVYGEPAKLNSEVDIQKVALLAAKLASRMLVGVPDINRHTAGLWELQNGTWVMANIKREQNPLLWDTIFWFGPETVKELQKEIDIEGEPT